MRQNYEQHEQQLREKINELEQENAQLKLENKKIEEALRLSEEKLERLIANRSRELEEANRQKIDILEYISDCFYALDKDLRFVYVNKSAEKIWGLSKADLIGRRIEDVFPGLIDISLSKFRQVIKEQIPVHYEVYSKVNQRWGDISVYPTHDGIFVHFRDITERKMAEQALRESEQVHAFHSEILESVRDPLWVTDPGLRIVYWNAAAAAVFGWTADEVMGRNSSELFKVVVMGWTLEAAVSQVLKKGDFFGECLVYRKDGNQIFIEASSRAVRGPRGEVILLVNTARDITERKRCEEALNKSKEALEKAIKMKDEFLSLVSHEFKTPLTVINSAVQAMRKICSDELSERSNRFLNRILQNSNRQLKLVNNLLDITRINAGSIKINLTNIDIILLTRVITESIMIFAEQREVKLSFTSTLKEKVIGIDEEKYERILLNLLSNAIKFTPKGKSITVKVSQKVVRGKRKVCIQVKDQGIGIPPDKQKLIFERFGQVDSSLSRQAEGTGIGLSLVKMFVEIMGGEIAVESAVGKGSMFTVLFPAAKTKATPIEEMLQEIDDGRLIQATAIEFSDIY